MNRHLVSWGVCIGMCAATMALAGDRAHRRPSATPVTPSVTDRCSQHHEVPYAIAGRNAFVDPKDGRIVPRPIQPQAPLPAQAQNALSTSGEGLREVPGKTRSGGMKVHLQGRFRSTVSASTDSGRLTTRCQTDASSSTP